MQETNSLAAIYSVLQEIKNTLKSRKLQCTLISTTSSGTIKPGASSVSIISSGTTATITINSVVFTTVANRSYTFGSYGKNDVINYDIAYDGGATDTLQIIIEYGGTY